jgi:hypothetical protein
VTASSEASDRSRQGFFRGASAETDACQPNGVPGYQGSPGRRSQLIGADRWSSRQEEVGRIWRASSLSDVRTSLPSVRTYVWPSHGIQPRRAYSVATASTYPRREMVSGRWALAFDDRGVRDDHALVVDQEVPLAECVAPVLVVEPARAGTEGGVEQVADRRDLLGRR